MIISYERFVSELNAKIKTNDAFYCELLKNVINNPNRYTGVFRLSNAKTKLIQNVTQSREIKFGDFMETIVTEYIAKLGYTNLDKSIGKDNEGNALNADQVFADKDTVYLIEQKIRDDHDSTKKRGQYQNFHKKFMLLKRKHPNKHITAVMWFIDDSLTKNKCYYSGEADKDVKCGVEIHIYYGNTLFTELFQRADAWNEIVSYLQQNKRERSEEILIIPDFDTSDEILQALKILKQNDIKLYKKLMSDKPEYVQLRSELFPTGYNFDRI